MEECFQSKKQADSFEGMVASVNEITQKQVVEVFNVLLPAILEGRPIESKEAHQVRVLAVNITEYFERGTN